MKLFEINFFGEDEQWNTGCKLKISTTQAAILFQYKAIKNWKKCRKYYNLTKKTGRHIIDIAKYYEMF